MIAVAIVLAAVGLAVGGKFEDRELALSQQLLGGAERDLLGDNLPPDYVTSVQQGLLFHASTAQGSDDLLFFGRIHPDKGTAAAIAVAARAEHHRDSALTRPGDRCHGFGGVARPGHPKRSDVVVAEVLRPSERGEPAVARFEHAAFHLVCKVLPCSC